MKKWLIRLALLALIVPILLIVVFITARPFLRRMTARHKWVMEKKEHVLAITPDAMPPYMTAGRDGDRFAFHVKKEGAIRIAPSGWVYMVIHSSHDDDPNSSFFQRIGDATVARDHLGNVYVCGKHICGELTLSASSSNEFASLQEFLESPRDEIMPGEWRKLE